MSETIKILPMAQLLRLAKEKKAREEAETVPEISTVVNSSTVPKSATILENQPLLYRKTTVPKSTTIPEINIVPEQFTPIPNGILDGVLSRLKPSEQVILLRLYRLSRGFHSETCRVGFNTLARSCNISKTTAQVTIARLIELSYIEVIGVEQGGTNRQERGTIYRVNLPAATISKTTTVPKKDTVVKSVTVAKTTTNKEHTLKETHTNTEGVRVGSHFTLAECRRYADSLRHDGITNPGGYATKIHRSGEADELIESFLSPSEPPAKVDTSHCPDCHGTGFYYPQGTSSGVAKCKHERLSLTKEKRTP